MNARIEEHNARLMIQQALRRRGMPTPEVPFVKRFDNSRLVKTPDLARARQMGVFSAAVTILLTLTLCFGFQHFSSIESGYRIEAEKQLRDRLREENRQLRLSEAQLTQPERIDRMARAMGLAEPQPGQIAHSSAGSEAGTPVIARATPPKNSF